MCIYVSSTKIVKDVTVIKVINCTQKKEFFAE